MWGRRSRISTFSVIGLFASLALGTLVPAWSATPEVPAWLERWLFLEQKVNDRVNDLSQFAALDIDEVLPKEYNPKYGAVFDIGYVEIPIDDFRSFRGSGFSQASSEILIVRRGTQTYVRYFVHPLMEKSLASVIRHYGGLIHGEYTAAPTASPRSLMIWSNTNPKVAIGMKVSLGLEIGGTRRLNAWDKLSRSHALNETLAAIPSSVRKKYGFEFLAESFQMDTPGKTYGNIVREIPLEKISGNQPKLIPGFSLASFGPDGGDPMIVDMIRRSGLAPDVFIREKVMRPLMRGYTYLAFQEGLLGEPHQQNVYFEVNSKGDLTGRVVFKDLDAFRPDLELRALNGKTIAPYLAEAMPSKNLKLNQALGFMEESFGVYVKREYPFLFETVLKKYAKELKIDKKQIRALWDAVDQLMVEELVDQLGSRAAFGDGIKGFVGRNRARLEMLYPHVNWDDPVLNSTQVRKLIGEFGLTEIYSTVGNHYKDPVSDLPQKLMDNVKAHYAAQPELVRWAEAAPQELLRDEFVRLAKNYRATNRSALPKNARFSLANGAIVARTERGAWIGMALPEPENFTREFYKWIEHPREMPGSAFRDLWKFIRVAFKK